MKYHPKFVRPNLISKFPPDSFIHGN
jgi:hypothetical protein